MEAEVVVEFGGGGRDSMKCSVIKCTQFTQFT